MPRRIPPLLAALVDAAAIVVFVVMGRGSHSEGESLDGIAITAAPFLLGALAGWAVGVAVTRAWREPVSRATGLAVWAGTLVVGMALRNLAFDDGTAVSFIAVAAAFLAVFLLGWRRGAEELTDRRRRTRAA